MDKNQVTGLLLISLLVLVYFYFFAPPVPPPGTQGENVPITERNEEIYGHQPAPGAQQLEDSLSRVRTRERLGIFADKAEGQEQESVLENENVKITFNNKGGGLKRVLLKNYLTWDKRPLLLFDEENDDIKLIIKTIQSDIDLSQLFYEARQETVTEGDAEISRLTYTLNIGEGQSIIQTYSLPRDGYQLDYNLSFKGMDNLVTNNQVQYYWLDHIRKVEMNLDELRNLTTINYRLESGESDNLDASSLDKEVEQINEPINWVSKKQKFFTTAFISREGNQLANGMLSKETPPQDTTVVKTAEVLLNIPLASLQENSGNFTYYFGPNNYQVLKKVAPDFSNNVYLGWGLFSWVNIILTIPIFNFLENYIANYGIIIIILVLIVKLILSPLSYKSYVSMAKTKVLKPEIDELKEKHKDDMQKFQSEQMQLYQKVGINPLSGCIPMLLQLPILLALFNFFPNSIELRQESFLWADDLSTYDSILNLPIHIPAYGSHVSLFTLLMALSTIFLTWSNSQMTTVQGPMKTMQYLMPVMLLFFLNSYSAGLTFYYFVSNVVTFGQQAIIKRFVDEDKIRAILEENRKRNQNKKKSKFQQRLEEAMKGAEEVKKTKKPKN